MSRTVNGQEYLTQEEAIQRLNERGIEFTSPIIFRSLRDRYGIKGVIITGQGRSLFYKPEDIDKIPLIQEAEE